MLIKHRCQLKALILRVFNWCQCSIMHITCSKIRFSCSLEYFRNDHPFSKFKAWTIFHVLVDLFQSISGNTCDFLRHFLLQQWSLVATVLVYNMVQISKYKRFTACQSQWARRAWNGDRYSYPTVVVLFVPILTHKNVEGKRRSWYGKWCLQGTLEVSEKNSTEEAFCKFLLSHFRFKISKAQLIIRYGASN